MNIAIFYSLIALVKKILPDGDKKIQVLLAIEQLQTSVKQPLTLSILSILVYVVFAGKSIAYRIMMIVYFNTPEWWVDVVLVAIVFGFQFGVPFKDIIKAITERKRS